MTALRRLDLIVAWVALTISCALAIILLVRGQPPAYWSAAFVGVAAAVVYLLWPDYWQQIRTHTSDAVLCTAFAWLAFAAALIIFAVRSDPYVKPLGYYIMAAVSAGFAAMGAMSITRTRQGAPLLLLAVALALSYVWTEAVMFPTVIGMDPQVHLRMTVEQLALAGTQGRPPLTLWNMGGSYSLMHVYLREMMQVLPITYKWAALIFWSSLQVATTVLLVYAIARLLWHQRLALLAALLVGVANWVVFFGQWAIPNGMGAPMMLLAIYLVLLSQRGPSWWAWLSLPLLVVAYLTHILNGAWVLAGIVATAAVHMKTWNVRPLALPLAASALTGLWLITSGIMPAVGASVASGALGTQGLSVGETSQVAAPAAATIPVPTTPALLPAKPLNMVNQTGDMLTSSLGVLLYLGVGLLGLLIMVRHRQHWAWAVLTGLMMVGAFVAPALGVPTLEHRWMYAVEVLLAMPLALVLWRWPSAAAGLAVMVIAFFSLTAIPGNQTNGVLADDVTVRYALTESEMAALPVAEAYKPKSIGTDPIYQSYLISSLHYAEQHVPAPFEWALLTGDFTQTHADVLILRDALRTQPLAWGDGGIYRLTYDPVEVAEQQGWTVVWGNEATTVMVWR